MWDDSPLVRAMIHGRVIVLDEFDKAPVEVVCVLKGLLTGDASDVALYDLCLGVTTNMIHTTLAHVPTHTKRVRCIHVSTCRMQKYSEQARGRKRQRERVLTVSPGTE